MNVVVLKLVFNHCHPADGSIRGKINTLALSPHTLYGTYLVFKMINASRFENYLVELSVGMRDIFNLGLEDGEVQLSVIAIKDGHWKSGFFFGGVRGSNPEPCIYYALSLPIELSSR
ncbi:phloem protein [Medicago truncatula]|uniref:Phloem protein n=1 Tax=Medicago truncatula TaxID=3880 RepID=G7I679_MEDTR|nr:phloem protein [Medicago truncatula]